MFGDSEVAKVRGATFEAVKVKVHQALLERVAAHRRGQRRFRRPIEPGSGLALIALVIEVEDGGQIPINSVKAIGRRRGGRRGGRWRGR